MSAALLPTWVAPAPRQLTDAHWIAHNVAAERGRATLHGEVCAILDRVTDGSLDRAAAAELLLGDGTGTIAWLLGYAKPPFELPRRNPDGTLLTVAQLVAAYMAGKWDGPEERRDADRWARKQAARSQQLASLVPH